MNRAEKYAVCPEADASVVRAGLAAAALGDRVVIVCRDVRDSMRRAVDLLDGPEFAVGLDDVQKMFRVSGSERIIFAWIGGRRGSLDFTTEASVSFRTRGIRADVLLWEAL